jgi:hypothetical protein
MKRATQKMNRKDRKENIEEADGTSAQLEIGKQLLNREGDAQLLLYPSHYPTARQPNEPTLFSSRSSRFKI